MNESTEVGEESSTENLPSLAIFLGGVRAESDPFEVVQVFLEHPGFDLEQNQQDV